MKNSNSKRWWMTGISAICLAAVTSLWAADPTTAPSASATPAVTPAAGAAPAVTPADTSASSKNSDQSNNNRRNRGRNNNGNGNGNNNGYRSSGGGAGAVNPDDPYSVLQTRSIFVKGNQSLVRPEQPVYVAPPITRGSGVSENLLVFNGVTIVNEKPEALVEDLRSNVVFTIKIGDSVAGGIVAAIDFDDLSYQVRGQIRHVGLGDDFTGNAAYALAAPTTAPAPLVPGQIGTGASIPPVVAPTPSGMSTEDVLARLKAKRAQEAQQLNK